VKTKRIKFRCVSRETRRSKKPGQKPGKGRSSAAATYQARPRRPTFGTASIAPKNYAEQERKRKSPREALLRKENPARGSGGEDGPTHSLDQTEVSSRGRAGNGWKAKRAWRVERRLANPCQGGSRRGSPMLHQIRLQREGPPTLGERHTGGGAARGNCRRKNPRTSESLVPEEGFYPNWPMRLEGSIQKRFPKGRWTQRRRGESQS